MNILGINFYYHDSSACIVSDGRLVVAIEEERLTRDKHTGAPPERAIRKCLQVAGLEPSDIDYVAISIKPGLHWPAKVLYGLRHFAHARTYLRHEVARAVAKNMAFKRLLRQFWPDPARSPKICYVPHHLAHVAGSFYVSPYDSAALLSLDGAGEWATSYLGAGAGTTVTSFQQSFFPMSFGAFYEAATQFCGFLPNYDEGKTMGLAPLGDPSVYYDKVKDMLRVTEQGDIKVDLSCFSYQYWGYQRFGERFHKLFGKPRVKGEGFEENHLNVAAAFQRVLEDRALDLCRILRSRSREKYLVIAGGVSLNSVMNGRIIREGVFDDLYVMPAAGDNGTSIGAAFYLWNGVLGKPRTMVHDDPYVGNSYSNDEIEKVLKECKLPAVKYDNVTEVVAKQLHEGNIIGWFQGRMEIGPRALGNRSILANPTLSYMKDKINAEVKHREAYRPFAPSVPVERKSEFFDLPVNAPFMLKVCDVISDKKEVIPAVTHVDGSARLQTVDQNINPRYHSLLTEFGKLSNVPVLLNTSFNVMGEPIVESPADAIRCFYGNGLDVLVLGDFVITKKGNPVQA